MRTPFRLFFASYDSDSSSPTWKSVVGVLTLAGLLVAFAGVGPQAAHAQQKDSLITQNSNGASRSILLSTIESIGGMSPSAASLGKFGDVPVDKSNGIPNISIPLVEAEGNDLSLPIALSYHGRGVKVDAVGSHVGLGWSLDAGGVITHAPQGPMAPIGAGAHDKLQPGGSLASEFGDLSSVHVSSSTRDLFDARLEETTAGDDFMPDKFNFNIGSHSGKFFLKSDGSVVETMPHQKLDIDYNSSSGTFTATAKDGKTYHFDKIETTNTSGGIPSDDNYGSWASAWRLSKITTPVTKKEITFAYDSVNVSHDYLGQHIYTEYSGTECGTTTQEDGPYEVTRTTTTHYPTEIETPEHVVELSYATRSSVPKGVDNSAVKLTTVSLYGKNTSSNKGDLIKKYELTYDSQYDRLFLTKVEEVDVNDNVEATYSMTYRHGLPERLSAARDHHGYYNGANGNDGTDKELIPSATGQSVSSADRDVDTSSVKKGTLETITYPTGGESTFYFESNSADGGQNAGVRIRKIRDYDPVKDKYTTKKFDYGPATGPAVSSLLYKDSYSFDQVDCDVTLHFSKATTLGIEGKTPVHYDSVRVKKFFDGEKERETVYRYKTKLNGSGETGGGSNKNLTDMAWNRGFLEEKRVYDGSGNVIVEEIRTYDSSDLNYVTSGIDHTQKYGDVCPEANGDVDVVRGLAAKVDRRPIPNTLSQKDRMFPSYSKYCLISAWPRLKSVERTRFDPSNGTSLVTKRRREYDTDDLQPLTIARSTSNGLHSRQERRYVGSAHMHSRVRATWLADDSTDSQGNVIRGDSSHWEKQNQMWQPRKQYALTSTGGSLGQTGWTRTRTFDSYNSYGQVTKSTGPRGNTRDREYVNSSPYLDSLWQDVGGTTLSVEFTWTQSGLVDKIIDENDNTRSFVYDDLGRLETVKNDNSNTLVTHSYNFTAAGNDPANDPSYVETVRKGGSSPSQTTTEYSGGLGRSGQVHEHVGSGRIVRSSTADAFGRTHRSYKPFRQSTDGFTAKAASSNNVEHTDREYSLFPFEKPTVVDPPLTGQIDKSYGVESNPYNASGNLPAYSSHVFSFVETTDEGGDVSRVYKDGFGRTVIVARGVGTGSPEVTYFQYDDAGRLTKMIRPEGDAVTYAYDGRGQLVEHDGPDRGKTEWKRDEAGNVRFRQDKAERTNDQVAFTTYDGLGRTRLNGLVDEATSGTFSTLDPDTSHSWEDAQNAQKVRAYDTVPSGSSAPWSNCSCTPSNLSLDNLKGRLAARAARNVDKSSEGLNTTISTDWRFTFFSYDAEGRVKKKKVFAPGLGEVTLTYDRDRQGRLTERKTVLNDQGGATFYQAYTYNERGTVKEIYASTSQPDPSADAPDVEYRYAAHGAIDSVKYEGSSWIARDYDDRDRLTDVGDTSSPVGFAGTYAYDADGTVDQALSAFESTSVGSPPSNYTYHFSYDSFDRLESADYGGLGLGGKYDVSSITYDQNGNLKTLERRGDQGSLVDDLTYKYEEDVGEDSPNRLDNLDDAAGAVHGWDADTGTFDHTVLGQLAETPAPQGLTGAVYGVSGQLLEAEQGGQTTSYRYSGTGQRTFKQVGTQSAMYYVRDGAELLAVVEGSSVRHWNITRPGGPAVGRHEPGGSRRYYVTDLLGSIRAVLPASGDMKGWRNYYPFGLRMPGFNKEESVGAQEDFTGHVKDDTTGLHYAGARYYSAAFGRWLRPDPVLGTNPKELLEENRPLLTMTSYNYAFDRPTTLSDPTGLFPDDCPPCEGATDAEIRGNFIENGEVPSMSSSGVKEADLVSDISTAFAGAGVLAAPFTQGASLVITEVALNVGAAADLTSTAIKGKEALAGKRPASEVGVQAIETALNIGGGVATRSIAAGVVTRTGTRVQGPLFRSAKSGRFISNKFGLGVKVSADATGVGVSAMPVVESVIRVTNEDVSQ